MSWSAMSRQHARVGSGRLRRGRPHLCRRSASPARPPGGLTVPHGAARRGVVPVGIGSVLLLPELLSKPLRDEATTEVEALAGFLSRLDLRPVDLAAAELAVTLAAEYRLRAADAVHLATAVTAGADRFITNNQRDFPLSIVEVDIAYPGSRPDGRPSDPGTD